jgi:hypothetical protein
LHDGSKKLLLHDKNLSLVIDDELEECISDYNEHHCFYMTMDEVLLELLLLHEQLL